MRRGPLLLLATAGTLAVVAAGCSSSGGPAGSGQTTGAVAATTRATAATTGASPEPVSVPTSPPTPRTSPVPAATSTSARAGAGTSPPAAAPAPAGTRVLHVRPVDASNHPLSGYAVTSTSTGAMCLPASEAVQGAYRCFAGNFVYDPCWAAADRAATPSAVLCLTRPWDSSVTRLVSGGRLAPQDRTISGSSATPWGVQLSGGTRCVLAQGTHDLFAGKVVDYTCEDSRTVVLRGIAIDGAQWRVATATRNSTGYTAGPSTLVARAWFGSPDPY